MRILSSLFLALSLATPLLANAAEPMPKALGTQVTKLVDLVTDAYATGYPEASMFLLENPDDPDSHAFVVFTVEGYGGGNNFEQILAAFQRQVTEEGDEHYQFFDYKTVGGAGSRSIDRIESIKRQGEQIIVTLSGMENTEEDAPNFPSKPMTSQIVYKHARFQNDQ